MQRGPSNGAELNENAGEPDSASTARSLARPVAGRRGEGVREPREQVGERGDIPGRPIDQQPREACGAIVPGRLHESSPGRRQLQSRPPRVGGGDLAGHHACLRRPSDQPAGSGGRYAQCIGHFGDADRAGGISDGQTDQERGSFHDAALVGYAAGGIPHAPQAQQGLVNACQVTTTQTTHVSPPLTLYMYDTHMQSPMMVAVLGGTGRTGRPLVAELLRRGHKVVVLARDPAKLGMVRDEVQVITGDSRDEAALTELVSGADAVVSTLGPVRGQGLINQDAAKALIFAMRRAGVRR
jgi:hypothetical protein